MRAAGPLDSLGTILSGLAKRLGLETRLLELRLQREWKQIVGEPIASNTWPDQIRFKKLYLTVRNSVWMQQLTFLKSTLLAKINAAAGNSLITDLALRVGGIPVATPASGLVGPNDQQLGISDTALTEAATHAASIQDPDLRHHLTKMMAEAMSRTTD